MLVGSLETGRLKMVNKWSEFIRQSGSAVTTRQPVFGHDSVMWREWFGDALLTEFGNTKHAPDEKGRIAKK